jgi:hypothetical protein
MNPCPGPDGPAWYLCRHGGWMFTWPHSPTRPAASPSPNPMPSPATGGAGTTTSTVSTSTAAASPPRRRPPPPNLAPEPTIRINLTHPTTTPG